ncbi:MAG: phosphonoacetate hydrolase [Deltaproteobacteria bacterium]|nr:phosphonoacetate hydrolase [Deltaproteobacteria bacterium]
MPYLLTPGPLTTAAATKDAMQVDYGSRDHTFIGFTKRVRERLLWLCAGERTHTAVMLQGSGTYAVEAAFGTLVPKDGKVAVLVNGAYGKRMVEIVKVLGRAHVTQETAEDVPVDPAALDRLLADDQAITDVAVVYTETTTGIRNPLEAIAAVTARHGRRLIVDAMSCFGALPIDLRTLPIDALCASSNKCLEGVPGIGFVIVRTEWLNACAGRSHSLALDLHAQSQGFDKNGQWRFTPPTHVLAAFDKALDLHAVEGGVEGRGARYLANQRVLVDGMRAMGFRTLLPDHLMSPTIVTFHMPQDPKFVFQTFYDRLREKGFVIYPGKLTAADSFRIGCIGDLTPEIMRAALGAIDETVKEMGAKISGDGDGNGNGDVTVNGRRYAWPKKPTVVICLDGCAPEYFEKAVAAGKMPNLAKMVERGTNASARCVIPSFTNPNNMSIVTGAPPSVHGISGNFFIDPRTGEEVMMNDPKFLRAPTLLAAFSAAGAKVVAITAKDKLRKMLGEGLKGVAFSAEKADKCTLAEHGITDVVAKVGMPVPDVYSAELSEFVLKAGVVLLKSDKPDILYLSTTDYVQHKHAPGTDEANAFYAMIDKYLGELDALGAVIAITADHGMNAKADAAGKPRVLYLGDWLDEKLGKDKARVILPITDPYVVHHGALGSFAWIHWGPSVTAEQRQALTQELAKDPNMEVVLDRTAAARRFELPADRVGDVCVITKANAVVGTEAARHDLTGLDAPLRSHGGLGEERVPLVLNVARKTAGRDLRNFDAFDLALNGDKQ